MFWLWLCLTHSSETIKEHSSIIFWRKQLYQSFTYSCFIIFKLLIWTSFNFVLKSSKDKSKLNSIPDDEEDDYVQKNLHGRVDPTFLPVDLTKLTSVEVSSLLQNSVIFAFLCSFRPRDLKNHPKVNNFKQHQLIFILFQWILWDILFLIPGSREWSRLGGLVYRPVCCWNRED